MASFLLSRLNGCPLRGAKKISLLDSGWLLLVRTGMKRNRLVLRLAPIGQDRDEEEQVGTEAGSFWSGQG